MKNKAFTLMEILIAMSIIGVLATATLSQIKSMNTDKTKMSFKNCYNHMIQTTDKILSDETIYPKISLSDFDNRDTTGRQKLMPIRYLDIDIYGNIVQTTDSPLFPRKFAELSQTLSVSVVNTNEYRFTLKDNSYWVVKYNSGVPSQASDENITIMSKCDYKIMFDVNGLNEGTNCPFTGASLQDSVSGTCQHPDTFEFGLTWNNKLIPDDSTNYYGKNLATFLKDSKYIE